MSNQMQRPNAVPLADQADQNEEEIDLLYYLYVLNKYKWTVLGMSVIIAIITALYTNTLVPMYQSTATLLIESQEEKVVSIQEVYGLPGANAQYFETQNQILRSRELAKRVVDELNLVTNPEFDPKAQSDGFISKLNPLTWIARLRASDSGAAGAPASNALITNSVVEKFINQLDIAPLRNSQLINISFESQDPQLAAMVPNVLAKTYIDSVLEGRLGVTKQAADWIVERLANLRDNVDKSEQALQQFLEKENLVDVQGVDSMATKELKDLSTELMSARKELTEYEEMARHLSELKGKPIQAYESLPAVLRDPTVQRAKDQQTSAQLKVTELSKRYGPKHPKMISAEDELASTTRNLETAIQNVVSSLNKEYDSSRSKVSEVEHQLFSSREQVKHINSKENELHKLQREVETNRQLYDMFLTRYKETNIAGDLKSANARVVDQAVVPSGPFKPNKIRIVLISVLLSLFIGIVLAFIHDSLDNTIKSTHDVERLLLLPVLSILPKLTVSKGEEEKILHYFSEHSDTKFAENVRTIRTGVLLTGIDEKKKSILVTSSVPSEGKSVVSANLALALGQMGKVLLIDADMRRPTIAKVFNLDKNQSSGLSHFIAKTEALDQCIHYFMKDNIYVMPAGVIPPNPLELLSSKRFQSGLEKILEAFDYIVLDSAPIMAVSDSIVLSQYVNSIAYVIKADDTSHHLVKDGLKRLRHVNAPIVGVVLNQVSAPKSPGRYNYYDSDYYHYYGYEKK